MNKISWQNLYMEHADHYDQVVLSEDYQGQFMAALRQICPIDHTEIVEFGAGTAASLPSWCLTSRRSGHLT